MTHDEFVIFLNINHNHALLKPVSKQLPEYYTNNDSKVRFRKKQKFLENISQLKFIWNRIIFALYIFDITFYLYWAYFAVVVQTCTNLRIVRTFPVDTLRWRHHTHQWRSSRCQVATWGCPVMIPWAPVWRTTGTTKAYRLSGWTVWIQAFRHITTSPGPCCSTRHKASASFRHRGEHPPEDATTVMKFERA